MEQIAALALFQADRTRKKIIPFLPLFLIAALAASQPVAAAAKPVRVFNRAGHSNMAGGGLVAAESKCNSFAVIVGVLEWPASAHLAAFSKEHRKDREFFDTLSRRGVPTNQMALLLDEQATREGMLTALRQVLARTTPGSTFVFYYAGHGSPGFLENYDCAAHGSFNISAITAAVKRQFQGRNVLLLADCCNSGGLGEVAKGLAAAGFHAASLTSADAAVESTSNWTFTQTILDALNGSALFDSNHDGIITLGETAAEVSLAMKFCEGQMCGYTLAGLPESWVLAQTCGAAALPEPVPGEFQLKDYVRVAGKNETEGRVGRIVGWEAGRYLLEFYDYSEKSRSAFKPAQLHAITLKTYEVGKTVTVSCDHEPLLAKIMRAQNDFYLIRYLGWPAKREEWVFADRILGDPAKYPPAQHLILAEWRNTWWPAEIKKTDADKKRYFIHYAGYGNDWDEWVTAARLKTIVASELENGRRH